MGYKIMVNPADLQDREAFLAFLHEQAERGYQVVRVLDQFGLRAGEDGRWGAAPAESKGET